MLALAALAALAATADHDSTILYLYGGSKAHSYSANGPSRPQATDDEVIAYLWNTDDSHAEIKYLLGGDHTEDNADDEMTMIAKYYFGGDVGGDRAVPSVGGFLAVCGQKPRGGRANAGLLARGLYGQR